MKYPICFNTGSLAAIMTTLKSYAIILIILLFGQGDTFGQNSDDRVLDSLKKKVDTVFLFSYGCYSYTVKDTTFRSMIVWRQNGVLKKRIIRDTTIDMTSDVSNKFLLDFFFSNDINSKENKKTKKDYWKRHYVGWINPLSNYFGVTFYYKRKRYSEVFSEEQASKTEAVQIKGEEKMSALWTIEETWLRQLKAEMFN